MAILDDVPGIRITLVSTGQNLVEHEVTDEEEPQPNTTSTFVQAESGRTFGFAITFDAALFPYKNDNIALALLKDGEMVRYWHFAPFFIASGFRKVINRFSVKEGGGNLAVELSFAELHITEENADMELWGKLGALGTVAFELCRIRYEYTPIRTPRQDNQFHMRGTARGRKGKALKNHSQRHGRYPVQLKRALLADDTVSEKNLKGRAISHQAKLNVHHWQSTESANANPSPTIRRTIQIDRTPFARFVFKYRSYEALRQLLVIPRSPSPVPLEARPFHELTADEMMQLQQRQRDSEATNANMVEIKREKRRHDQMDDSDDDEIEICEVRPRKAMKADSAAVMDMSENDL